MKRSFILIAAFLVTFNIAPAARTAESPKKSIELSRFQIKKLEGVLKKLHDLGSELTLESLIDLLISKSRKAKNKTSDAAALELALSALPEDAKTTELHKSLEAALKRIKLPLSSDDFLSLMIKVLSEELEEYAD